MQDYKRLFATYASLEDMRKYAGNKPAMLRPISGNEYALTVPITHKAWADKFVNHFDQGEA